MQLCEKVPLQLFSREVYMALMIIFFVPLLLTIYAYQIQEFSF